MKRKSNVQRKEKADITVVMPQMGVVPVGTNGRIRLYHKMVDWHGSQLLSLGHPHVVEPAETVEKDGDKKLIIYSMEISSQIQRIEKPCKTRENAKWTERGVLMDVTIKKKMEGAKLKP